MNEFFRIINPTLTHAKLIKLLIVFSVSSLMLQLSTNCVIFLCCSKETLLLEPEKSAPRIETLEPEKVDEGEEVKKDESSCSSEEEDDEDSESETEAGICVFETYFRLQ